MVRERPVKPLVVAQNNFVERLTGPLAERVRGMGIMLHDVSSGDMTGKPATPPGEWGPILVVGSILFVHQWAREDPILSRWMFWDDDKYDAAEWARVQGSAYLNHDGREDTIGGFVSSRSGAMHLRPRSGIKMVGEVVPTESRNGYESVSGIVDTPEGIEARRIEHATAIWASPPKEILAEIRVWMIGGAVAAASCYRMDGRHFRSIDHPLVTEAAKVAVDWHRTWHPDRHYVVDAGLTRDGWRIVEYNPIHSSGWYAADPGAVVESFFDSEGVAV